MTKLLMIITAVLAVGCGTFRTTQKESRYENGKLTVVILTKVSATTFFDSKSRLSHFRAMQTSKTQSATVGELTQEASATNLVQVLRATADIIEEIGKLKSPVPLP